MVPAGSRTGAPAATPRAPGREGGGASAREARWERRDGVQGGEEGLEDEEDWPRVR